MLDLFEAEREDLSHKEYAKARSFDWLTAMAYLHARYAVSTGWTLQ